MECIRKARKQDISRIAEILIFVKRINFRPIFQNDEYSFQELQVLNVAQHYFDHPDLLNQIWVYDDGIVKGLIQIEKNEVKTLYVDCFFQNEGIGSYLLNFAIDNFSCDYLWALEKNEKAIRFYNRHGFIYQGEWKYEEGTEEHLLKLKLSLEN